MRNRKIEEIKRMEIAKEKVQRDIIERQKEFEEEMRITEQLNRVKDEYEGS